MATLRKILSVLLAIVMVLGTAAIVMSTTAYKSVYTYITGKTENDES